MRAAIDLRGAALELWEDWHKYDEIMLDGPSGTGKSIVVAWLFDQFALNYPGCRLLVVRKTRASLTQSWMVTFQKAMKIAYGDEHDYLWEGAGNANRNSYVYRNGSEIVLGGMDNPTRLFSTEYDVVYVNEVNELALGDWESLNRACRNGVIGHNLLLADCNPAEEYHWANLRCRGDALVGQPETGRTHRMVSLHEDNPWITGTREGQKYLDRLRNQLTGVRRQRLYLGLWVSAEGAVYPQFSDQTHVVHGTLRSEKDDHYRGRPQDAPTIWFLDLTRGMGATVSEPVSIRLEWFFGSQDWGWTNPGHQSIWGVDKEGRMYLVWEWMRCEKMHQWWAERAVEANKKFGLWKMVCDNAEPEAIKVFNNMLSWSDRGDNEPLAIGCEKTRVGNRTNIDLVRDRLKVGADGHPRLMFLDDALRHKPDAMLEERGAPYCTAREVPGYVYGEVGDGKENREIPKKINDHGLDDMAYAVRYAHGRDMSATSREVEWSSPLSWGALADLPAEEHKLNMAGTQEMVRRRNA